jgi:hypothetical protein
MGHLQLVGYGQVRLARGATQNDLRPQCERLRRRPSPHSSNASRSNGATANFAFGRPPAIAPSSLYQEDAKL